MYEHCFFKLILDIFVEFLITLNSVRFGNVDVKNYKNVLS